jgi:hypothetical protein
MKWINSGGGPLICCEESISVQWKGVDTLSASSSHASDYARASSTQEYLERMACASEHVLVLGDEPLQSCFFRSESVDANLAIARWVYAESLDAAEKFLKGRVADTETLAPAVAFEVIEGKLVMFDSAMPWPNNLANCLRADIKPGSYLVTTEGCQLDQKYRFVVHRFSKT